MSGDTNSMLTAISVTVIKLLLLILLVGNLLGNGDRVTTECCNGHKYMLDAFSLITWPWACHNDHKCKDQSKSWLWTVTKSRTTCTIFYPASMKLQWIPEWVPILNVHKIKCVLSSLFCLKLYSLFYFKKDTPSFAFSKWIGSFVLILFSFVWISTVFPDIIIFNGRPQGILPSTSLRSYIHMQLNLR